MPPTSRASLGRKLLLAVGLPFLALSLAGIGWLRYETSDVAPGVWGGVLAFLAGLALATAALHVFAVRLLLEAPLARIVASLRRAERGDFLLRVPVESGDELGELAAGINTALAAITDLHANRLEDARSIEFMRLELELKAQIEAQHTLLDQANRRLEARLRELTLLADLARTMTSTLRLDELLRRVVDLVGGTLGHEAFAVLLVDERAGDLVVGSAFGVDPSVEGSRMKIGEGIAGWAVQHKEMQLVRDTRIDRRFPAHFWTAGQQGSLLALPLLHQDACLGTFDFFRPTVDAFGEEEVRFLQAVASQAAMAIANARLHERSVELSLTDPLTGLRNRRAFRERVEAELDRSGRFAHPFAVALLDVDDLGALGERHGQLAADAVVRRVAGLLASGLRKADTVARHREFALLLPRADRQAALEVVEKLRAIVSGAAFSLGDEAACHVSLSAGVSSYPGDAGDVDALLDCADAALSAAKRAGRDRALAHGGGMRSDPARDGAS